MKYHHFIRILLISFCLVSHGFLHGQTITTVAGNGMEGYSGDGGQATNAQIGQPSSVAVDGSGNIYLFDSHYDNIRKVAANGVITTISGDLHKKGILGIEDVAPCSIHDGGPATDAMVWKPQGIATDYSGNVYFVEVCGGIRKIAANGIITTVANNQRLRSYNGDSDLAANAMRFEPRKIATDREENIYYADEKANVIRRISTRGVISTVAGTGYQGYTGDGNKAIAARLNGPWGITVDDSGNVYINDRGNGRIRKVNTAGIITTIAGNGEEGYTGDGGPATNASFHDPRGIAADHYGNLYIADAGNNVIRRLDADGIINTFAGNGKQLYRGDGGPASAAQLYGPMDVAVDRKGNVFIADSKNHAIRKVTAPPPGAKAPAILSVADTADNFTVSADSDMTEVIIKTVSGAYATYNISGMQNRELASGTITGNQTKIDVRSLPPGSYYITLVNGNKRKTLRFVLDR